MILIATILLVAILIFKIVHDYKKWIDGKIIDHRNKKNWIILAVSCIPSIILYSIPCNSWWAVPISATMSALFIWLFFDGFYNILRGFNWWYTGTDDKEDALTDNFLQSIPLWLHIVIKILPLITIIYLYIKSLS